MQFIGVKIPDELATLINEEVKRSDKSKSDIVRDALNQYFNVDIPEGSTLIVMDKNGLIELIDSRIGIKPEVKQEVAVVKQEVEPEVKPIKPDVQPGVKSTIQRLSEDLAAQDRIKELWRGGERNRARIAELIGYKQRTVQQYIKDCLDRGELAK